MAPQPKKAQSGATKSAPGEAKAAKAASTSATAPASKTPSAATSENGTVPTGGLTKPDQTAHNNEQTELKKQIDALQTQLNALREKINQTTSKGGPGAEKRAELRAQLDEIKGKQSNIKNNRTKIFDQLKSIQEQSQKRAKELQASKQKISFKTVEDIDNHIRNLERQIESGSLTLTAEKKALAEANNSKRMRRTVEQFQAEQDAIDAERARADTLRKELDDPESKAISDRYESIKTELDKLKIEDDEAYANRSKLFDQRKELESKLNDLWTTRKEAHRLFREASDRYYKRVQEERAKRAERYAAQRAAAEEEKRRENALRIREEAEIPAYQAQIEDCQTLIDFLTVKSGGGLTASSLPAPALNGDRTQIAGVPHLEARTIDTAVGDGLVVRKKKGEDEENYFVGGKGKKKGGAKAATNGNGAAPNESTKLNLPLPTLSALLSLSIPPPANNSDINRTIADLKTKKEWFEANQARVTAENIAKAEEEIKKLDATSKSPSSIPSPPNGKTGEYPVEPVPTPATADESSNGVSPDNVVEKLEEVKEAEETEA